jgi:hypothetical protein
LSVELRESAEMAVEGVSEEMARKETGCEKNILHVI